LVVVLLAMALGVAAWSVQRGALVTKLCSISLSRRQLLRHPSLKTFCHDSMTRKISTLVSYWLITLILHITKRADDVLGDA